jgi:hypothetical protein
MFRGINEQFIRQKIWNRDIQWGINTFEEGFLRIQALNDTITALEERIDTLIEGRAGEV